jgi:hypothetical protein
MPAHFAFFKEVVQKLKFSNNSNDGGKDRKGEKYEEAAFLFFADVYHKRCHSPGSTVTP